MTRPSPNEPEPHQPVQIRVIPYATPAHLRVTSGCWREGKLAIFDRGGKNIPEFCFKCGEPASGFKRFVVSVYPLMGLEKRAAIAIPLCRKHHNIIRARVLSVWILVILAAPLMGMGMGLFYTKSASKNPLLLGSALAVIAAIWGYLGQGQFSIQGYAIDERYVTLKGAGKEFLEKLPEYPEQ